VGPLGIFLLIRDVRKAGNMRGQGGEKRHIRKTAYPLGGRDLAGPGEVELLTTEKKRHGIFEERTRKPS